MYRTEGESVKKLDWANDERSDERPENNDLAATLAVTARGKLFLPAYKVFGEASTNGLKGRGWSIVRGPV